MSKAWLILIVMSHVTLIAMKEDEPREKTVSELVDMTFDQCLYMKPHRPSLEKSVKNYLTYLQSRRSVDHSSVENGGISWSLLQQSCVNVTYAQPVFRALLLDAMKRDTPSEAKIKKQDSCSECFDCALSALVLMGSILNIMLVFYK